MAGIEFLSAGEKGEGVKLDFAARADVKSGYRGGSLTSPATSKESLFWHVAGFSCGSRHTSKTI